MMFKNKKECLKMPIGFKRANEQKHKFKQQQKHSKRNHLKENVNNLINDNDLIIQNKCVETVKYMFLVNRDTNIKKYNKINVDRDRDIKFALIN